MSKKLIASVSIITALTIGLLVARTGPGRELRHSMETIAAHLSTPVSEPFPEFDMTSVSKHRTEIVDAAKREYTHKPVSYDSTVLKYSQGTKESWCADFVSWINYDVGSPLSNPESGSWRIPGVLTLQKYYINSDKYRSASQYSPQPGDVAIYVGKTFYGRNREHTNIVLGLENGMLTTIGGNENGRLRIDHQRLQMGENDLVGFGISD